MSKFSKISSVLNLLVWSPLHHNWVEHQPTTAPYFNSRVQWYNWQRALPHTCLEWQDSNPQPPADETSVLNHAFRHCAFRKLLQIFQELQFSQPPLLITRYSHFILFQQWNRAIKTAIKVSGKKWIGLNNTIILLWIYRMSTVKALSKFLVSLWFSVYLFILAFHFFPV